LGVGRIDRAVADAGPLIHLDEIRGLFLLNLFDRLIIPESVWAEALYPGRVNEDSFASLAKFRQHFDDEFVAEFVRDHQLRHLHVGECQALYACRIFSVPILLTDDLAVRDSAQRMGITPVGSLGIIIRSFRAGLMQFDVAYRMLRQLGKESSLYVTPVIVDFAINQLEQQKEIPEPGEFQ